MLFMPHEDPANAAAFKPLGKPLPRKTETPVPQPTYVPTGTPGIFKNTESGKLETQIPTPTAPKLVKPPLGPIPGNYKNPIGYQVPEGETAIRWDDLPLNVQNWFLTRPKDMKPNSGDRYSCDVLYSEHRTIYYKDKDDNWTFKKVPRNINENSSLKARNPYKIIDDYPFDRLAAEIDWKQTQVYKDMIRAAFCDPNPKIIRDPKVVQQPKEDKIEDWMSWFKEEDIAHKNLFNKEMLNAPMNEYTEMIHNLQPNGESPLFKQLRKTPFKKTLAEMYGDSRTVGTIKLNSF